MEATPSAFEKLNLPLPSDKIRDVLQLRLRGAVYSLGDRRMLLLYTTQEIKNTLRLKNLTRNLA